MKDFNEAIVLKNKNLKISFITRSEIEGEQAKKVESNVTPDSAQSEESTAAISLVGKKENILIIEKESSFSEYESDEEGFAKESGGEKILLTDLANKEKRQFYKYLLQNKYNEIENLIILTGAGSSVDVGIETKGLTMTQLWDKLDSSEKSSALSAIIKKTGYNEKTKDGSIKKDLESLLSIAGMMNAVQNDVGLEKAINEIKSFIVKECSLELDDDAPHAEFLNKVALRPQKYPRVKIFTLNYDTLFEQAAAKERFTVIDGFTFSNPRLFNGKYFDYDIIETRHNRQDKKDSTIAKLFYLFKMHGSLNWRKNFAEVEQADGDIEITDRVMIFPQNNKYEHSYEQPYFEMMARFQQALRLENTLLITVGFSFVDKHISSVIIESLKQNPSLNLMSFTYKEIVGKQEAYQKELHQIADIQSRVTLIAETFKDFTSNFPENIAHIRFDLLDSLNEELKQLKSINAKS